jgi:hypothetical protein
MKTIRLLVFVLIGFGISPGILSQTEQLVVNLTHPGNQGYLSFVNPKGSVKITGYNGEVILVNARMRITGNPQGKTGIQRIEQKTFEISAEEKNNSIVLFCNSNNKTIDFDIKIPRKFSIKISSKDNGRIEIVNIEGDIEADNPGGDIILNNVSGSAVLNAINGKIVADFTWVKPGSPLMLTTLEGNIELYLPENTNANIKIRSQNGELFSEFSLKPLPRKTQVKKNEGGNVFSLEDWTMGTINNGGPEYVISTFNGNVYLKKSRSRM